MAADALPPCCSPPISGHLAAPVKRRQVRMRAVVSNRGRRPLALDAETGYGHDPLLEQHSAARPRPADLEPPLSLRWVTDPRTPALSLQAPVCLRPGWGFLGILHPMDQGGLIAPLRE